jgi:phage tail-like protein
VTQPTDVITANRFSITIDGYEIATFAELDGINNGEYAVSTSAPTSFTRIKPPTITLRRGMNGSLELWSWHEAVRQGTMGAARRSCTLTMYIQ